MATTKPTRLSCEVDLEKDGRQTGFVRLPHSVHRSAYGWLPIPIVCLKNGPGPRILMMAGNHGDEWEGQMALNHLVRTLKVENVRGRIVILSSANFPAAMAGMRTSPIDDGNLNRSFPGDPDGGVTQQIAYFIEHWLLPQCDYVFDFHSGGSSLMYIPSTLHRILPDKARMDRATGRMKAFGAPFAYIPTNPQGADRTLTSAAERQGVEYLATELGGGGQVQPAVLKLAEEGMLRLLTHVGALEGVAAPPPGPVKVVALGGRDHYVYAPDGGVFVPHVELGDEVKAGQSAGEIRFHDTPWREPSIARFERDGTVICKRVPARTERGDCLFHLVSDYPG
jgi:predicted deacylase